MWMCMYAANIFLQESFRESLMDVQVGNFLYLHIAYAIEGTHFPEWKLNSYEAIARFFYLFINTCQ